MGTLYSYLQAETGGSAFLFPLGRVQEVMLACELVSPEVPVGALEGFVAVEDQHIPVLTLSGLLGLETSPVGVYSKWIRIRSEVLEYIVRVEEVPGVLEVSEEEVAAQSETLSYQGVVIGAVQAEGKREALLLDPDKLIQQAEAEMLQEWKERLCPRISAPDPLTEEGAV